MPTSASDHEGLTAMGVVLPPETAGKPDKYMKQLENKQSRTVIPEGRERKEMSPTIVQFAAWRQFPGHRAEQRTQIKPK